MSIISSTASVVHATQSQTVTQATYTRPPDEHIEPIYDEQAPVYIGQTGNYLNSIGTHTAGHHFNHTV